MSTTIRHAVTLEDGSTYEEAVTTITDEQMVEQVELELEMRGWGERLYHSKLVKERGRKQESTTIAASAIMKKLIAPLTEGLDTFVKETQAKKSVKYGYAVKYLTQVNTEVAAFLTLKAVFDSIASLTTLQKTALQIGTLIEDECRFRSFRKENRKAFDWTLKSNQERSSNYARTREALSYIMTKEEIAWKSWPTVERLHLGMKCVDILIAQTGLIKFRTQAVARNRRVVYLQATDEALEALENAHERAGLLMPVLLPTVIPPKPWTDARTGGYWTDVCRQTRLVKSYNSNYLDELSHYDLDEVFSAVNTVQATPWKVNREVLYIMDMCYLNNSKLGKLPRRDFEEIPAKPVDIADNEVARKVWRREAASVHNENRRHRSKRIAVDRMLQVAKMFKDRDRIYFPHNMDFRGRVYAMPLFLNPQGSHYAKGLLQFADAKPLGEQGACWLAIHGANAFGFDKATLQERVDWTLEHEERILSCAKDPMGDLWWSEADGGKGAWTFLAFCFEWAGFCEQGYAYESSLPIAMDGSCNGLQNLSAALRDEEGGRAVNLVASETPSDIYKIVADRVIDRVEQDIARGSVVAKQWRGHITRSVCKRPVMTLAYGAVEYGFRNQVMDDTLRPWKLDSMQDGYEGPPFPFENDGFAASMYISKLLWEECQATVTKATELMAWLQNAAKITAKEGLAINWFTPCGFPVRQEYLEVKGRRIKTMLAGNIIKLTLNEETDKVDTNRMSSGIAPNWTHSMDASHLMKTVNCISGKSVGLPSLHVIHDSFGTHACDTDMLRNSLKETFVDQYSEPVLEQFRDRILAQLSDETKELLPPLPTFGTLDLSLVMQSDFFFA